MPARSRQRPDLAGAHEALLLDVLAGRVGRHPGSPQGLDERRALVLLHGLATTRCAASDGTVPTDVRARSERCGRLMRARLIGLIAQLLLLAALAATVGLGARRLGRRSLRRR